VDEEAQTAVLSVSEGPIAIHNTHTAAEIITISLHDVAPLPRLSRPAVPLFETVGWQRQFPRHSRLQKQCRPLATNRSFSRATEIKFMSYI
jgi:hypothetical protein